MLNGIFELSKFINSYIITGHLTNHGEGYSHEEVRDLLQKFTEEVGNPFVYTDNHDGGYTLSEFVEPLLYNNGLDDDNVKIEMN